MSFGYLEFSRTIGGNHTHTRARRRLRARPSAVAVTVARAGASLGPGLGPRFELGCGIQPGPVLFEPGHTGLVYKQVSTRSATRPLRCNGWNLSLIHI